jgi:hypothetical protein
MKSKKYQIDFFCTLLIWVCMLGFTACEKEHCLDCFKGTGEIITEERTLENFNTINLSDRMNLYIQQDTVDKVIVEAGEKLISSVITEVDDGVLTIRDDNKCNWVRSYKKEINVYLHCSNLFMINYYGAGNVKSTNTIVSDSLALNFWDGSGVITLNVNCMMVKVALHTGPGDAEISGNTQYAAYYTRGNGQIRCSDLKSVNSDIDSKGTNDCYINCTGHLFARIGYIGNVYYSGSPTIIESEITERGQLIPLE